MHKTRILEGLLIICNCVDIYRCNFTLTLKCSLSQSLVRQEEAKENPRSVGHNRALLCAAPSGLQSDPNLQGTTGLSSIRRGR